MQACTGSSAPPRQVSAPGQQAPRSQPSRPTPLGSERPPFVVASKATAPQQAMFAGKRMLYHDVQTDKLLHRTSCPARAPGSNVPAKAIYPLSESGITRDVARWSPAHRDPSNGPSLCGSTVQPVSEPP
jgi:hypothetical protein